jgi:ATP/maltotriose-dependent transcriptional regulator MalT
MRWLASSGSDDYSRYCARKSKFKFEMESGSSPLAVLALETINSLNAENRSKISRLVLLSEFDLETAAIVLGEDFSESYINKLATDGLYVNVSSGPSRIYRFNDIVYEVLSQQEYGDPEETKKIHEKLASHFWDKGRLWKSSRTYL